MTTNFAGFTAESFAFFRELAKNNHKTWFEQNRERYRSFVLEPFQSLLHVLTPFLVKLNPNLEVAGQTNRNFSRINRDTRFSKDKRPYKDNYYLYVFDRSASRDLTGRLYVGLSAECVTTGFSIYASWRRGEQGALERIFRPRLARRAEVLGTLVSRILHAKHYETYWHRMEKREWAQHASVPRKPEDWQTLQAWIVRKVFLPNARSLATPAFARRVEAIFADLYPLMVFTSAAGSRWQDELKRLQRH